MVEIVPRETALIIVDPQNAFCHPDGTLGQSGVDVSNLVDVVPRIAELVTLCRAAGIPDIWTRQVHFPQDRTRDAHRIKAHTLKRKRVACQPGTWDADFVDELKPLVGDQSHIIEKYKWSVFFGTGLEPLLRILGAKLVIMCGSTTNACIDTSARDAYMRDYDVVIVEDCAGGIREDWHQMSLEVLAHYVGEVVTLAELRKMLPGASEAA